MNCQEFWNRMPESPVAGSQADQAPADHLLVEHMRGCVSCTALMEGQRALQAGLRRMALEQSGLEAPAQVEAALLRQFRAHAVSAQRPARAGWALLGTLPRRTFAAAIATAALVAVLLWYRAPFWRALPPSPSAIEDSATLDSGFVPLLYAGGVAPNADAAMVRVEVPRSTLVALGAPLADQATGGTVEAELLLGPGGMPQAVRVVE